MRKRIALGLAVLAVIGMGGYVLSQPRKGTVEYHKEQFLKTERLRRGEAWVLSHTPRFLEGAVTKAVYSRKRKRYDFHREALVALGYLEKRRCYVTNRDPKDIIGEVSWRNQQWQSKGSNPGFKFIGVSEVQTNCFTLVALRTDMVEWEKFIREVDGPEARRSH